MPAAVKKISRSRPVKAEPVAAAAVACLDPLPPSDELPPFAASTPVQGPILLSRREEQIIARVREEAATFNNKMFGEMFVKAIENKYYYNDMALFNFLQELEDEPPVSIETFLDSEEFLGSTDLDVWPEVRAAIIAINSDWWKGPNVAYTDALLMGATSTGKCLAEGTPVILYDGTVKKVEDVVEGDELMGPDSKPRKVLSTTTGWEEMFKITPHRGDPYTVNRSHILSLRVTGLGKNRHGNNKTVGLPDGRRFREGELVNVSVNDYLAANNTFRHCVKGWRPNGIRFPEAAALPVDPYFVGVWLGDGTSKALSVTNQDEEILSYVRRYARKLGLKTSDYTYGDRCKTIGITATIQGCYNRLLTEMHRLGLCLGEKFIPNAYKTASIKDRLALLAGLIDTDGYYDRAMGGYEITTKSPRLCEDILFIARSLGFAAVAKDSYKECQTGNGGIYKRIWISGDREIPCLLPRKQGHRVSKRSATLSGITVEQVPDGTYYGFTLDGDGLFLLGDFTVTHNTEIAKVTMLYHIYLLGCLRNPQSLYGLPRATSIVFAIMAAKPHVTKRVVYAPLRKMINDMPWFQKHMRMDKLIDSEIYFTEKNVRVVMGGADADSILGEAIIAGIVDEVNFMNVVLKSKRAEVSTGRAGIYDQASSIYGAMSRRKKGRFISRGPQIGIICCASSTRYKGDFTDKRKKQAIDNNEKTIFIYDKKQYEVWPQERYCGQTFRLLVGNDILSDTRIIGDHDVMPAGALVLDIPVEYKPDFIRDPLDALRDVVGMSTSSYSPFFQRRFKILEAIRMGEDNGVKSILVKDNVILGVEGLPRVESGHYCQNPSLPRYVHIDLSLNSDRCGIAMVRFDGLMSVKRGVGDEATEERLPRATVELACSIEPDANNEISIAEIRAWVRQLKELYGYPIRVVTYDGWSSIESRQQWKKEGMRTGLVSVDKTSIPYKHLRDCINDGRLQMYRQDVLVEELFALEYDEVKDSIDHPPKGGKDVADAVCGAYFTMLQRRSSWLAAATDDEAHLARTRAEFSDRYEGGRA